MVQLVESETDWFNHRSNSENIANKSFMQSVTKLKKSYAVADNFITFSRMPGTKIDSSQPSAYTGTCVATYSALLYNLTLSNYTGIALPCVSLGAWRHLKEHILWFQSRRYLKNKLKGQNTQHTCISGIWYFFFVNSIQILLVRLWVIFINEPIYF